MATSTTQMRLLISRTRNCGLLHRLIRLPAINGVRLSSDEEPKLLERETKDVDHIRNVSRMPEYLWQRMKGETISPDEVLQRLPEFVTKRSHKKVLKKHYGKYGAASEVDPGMLWPTKKELEEIKVTENKLYPSLQEMVTNVQKQIKQKEEEYQQREAEVVANYAKLQTWMKDLEDRQQKKLAEAKAQKEKKEKLIEEVRAYFGYRVDPNDERFKELLDKKEKEEKKALKEARKKEKIAKEWEKITKMAAEAQAAHEAKAAADAAETKEAQAIDRISEPKSDKPSPSLVANVTSNTSSGKQ